MTTPEFARTHLPPISADVDEAQLRDPDFFTVIQVIWSAIRSFFLERPGQIIGASFILIMVWGTHGRLELLRYLWPDWRGPGVDLGARPQLIPGVPWDHEVLSFVAGAFLLVGIPVALIKFVFKQPLAWYGLGLPPRERWRLSVQTFLFVSLVSLPFFWVAAHLEETRQVYPLFRPFENTASFVLYELSYIAFFFAIEFIFRGFLLFGLAGVQDKEVATPHEDGGTAGVFYFGKYALLIQMLSYTAWHLGKPAVELWGALVWGLSAGATAYAVRSIWPIVLSHWLLNVFVDALVWRSM